MAASKTISNKANAIKLKSFVARDQAVLIYLQARICSIRHTYEPSQSGRFAIIGLSLGILCENLRYIWDIRSRFAIEIAN